MCYDHSSVMRIEQACEPHIWMKLVDVLELKEPQDTRSNDDGFLARFPGKLTAEVSTIYLRGVF